MQTVCNTYWDAGKGNLTAQNTRKPLVGRGSALDPARGAYSAPANTLVGGEGLAAPPQEPHPPLSVLRPRLSYPDSKISSDAVGYDFNPVDWRIWGVIQQQVYQIKVQHVNDFRQCSVPSNHSPPFHTIHSIIWFWVQLMCGLE